jgi:hypothetical protein
MVAPKSDGAVIEGRRHRFAELLAEGKTAAQAGEILIGEGFPASPPTVGRDLRALRPAWQAANAESVEVAWLTQKLWLEELRSDLSNVTIKPDRKIELALGILDRMMKLEGTAAPTSVQSTSVNLNLDAVDPATLPEYRRWLYETRFMDSAAKEKAFQLIRESGLNVRVAQTIDVPTSSPLWNEPTKKLEE